MLFRSFLGLTAGSAGAQARPLPTIAERTAGMQAMPGFFPLYWDEATGKLYWEIDKLDTEFLYQVSMASGLGSNPVGIDRGQLSGTYVLVARRTGPRVLLEQPNYKYQARVDNPDQKEAVRDAFAPSVHWGFDVVAQTLELFLLNDIDPDMEKVYVVSANCAKKLVAETKATEGTEATNG